MEDLKGKKYCLMLVKIEVGFQRACLCGKIPLLCPRIRGVGEVVVLGQLALDGDVDGGLALTEETRELKD